MASKDRCPCFQHMRVSTGSTLDKSSSSLLVVDLWREGVTWLVRICRSWKRGSAHKGFFEEVSKNVKCGTHFTTPAFENPTLNLLLRLYLCQRQLDIRLPGKQKEKPYQPGNSYMHLLLIVAGYPAFERPTLNHLLRLYIYLPKTVRYPASGKTAISPWH